MSEYARDVLLNITVTITTRNKSLDDFMTEMIKLRNELNSIGSNINQSVKKLHSLEHVEDFKTWIISNEINSTNLLEKVDEIKSKSIKFQTNGCDNT